MSRTTTRAFAGAALTATLLLSACGESGAPAATETVASTDTLITVAAEGELQSSKATNLVVPGNQWAERRLEWMLPEGSTVAKDELLARFSAESGEVELAQAMLDLQRNALARAAKEGELAATGGRVAVDLSQVGTQLGIAERYAGADIAAIARNQVLDAVQDVEYLGDKRDTLQWRQAQADTRGAAELAVLDAQRATVDLKADNQRADLAALELRAPHAGVLVLAENWSGEKPTVGGTLRAGQEFGVLPDTGHMEVELALPQLQAQGVRVGNVVEVFPPGHPEQAVTTELAWVASAAKALNRRNPVKYLSMKAPVPAEAVQRFGWVPGQALQARVVLLREPRAITVPNVAVRSEAGKHYVQVRGDGDGFVRREVELGVRGSARSQVLDGLGAGEEILLVGAGGASVDEDRDDDPDTETDADA